MFGSAPSTAPYPAVMYPASSFFGATSLNPQAGASEGAATTVTPQNRTHMVVFILVLVAVGYAAYHMNYD